MTILILSNNLSRGGKERQIAEILKHLAKNTQNQYVLILRENKIEFPLPGIVNLRVLAPENRLSIFRFILFGSRARGNFTSSSDWDVMVITRQGFSVEEKMYYSKRIREKLAQLGIDGDVLLKSESEVCLLYTSPSPRDRTRSRMPSSA